MDQALPSAFRILSGVVGGSIQCPMAKDGKDWVLDFPRRGPLQVVSSDSDKMQYVTFGAFAPPKQLYTAEAGSESRFSGAAEPD
jgi:hypothetical protein